MRDGQEEVETLTPLFKHRVAVSGRAVFRPSGRLLRLEAESVRDAAPSDRFFAKVPRPNAQRYDSRRVLKEQSHKRGVAAIIGKWPGEETDEQIDVWLRGNELMPAPTSYVLDTNIVLALLRNNSLGRAVDQAYALSGSQSRNFVCVVSVGELLSLAELREMGEPRNGQTWRRRSRN